MAVRERYDQVDSLEYKVAEGIKSGDPVILPSGVFGVAEIDAWKGFDGVFRTTIRTVGVFGFDYTGAVTENAAVYAAPPTSGVIAVKATLALASAAGNRQVGTAHEPKGSGAGVLYVRFTN
ncbi:head decoration [Clavibacter phage CN1A]|uniref:Uncharacterized protein n=1 Tax=Clavibacter phage CN1A TaxID=1406793 RepID=U5PT96_9CAUD|nr:head decoration [Clavibacter phage CN1A]AGY47165.1 hypothetical protein CN1A_56 [Clavibacter phage CN1A]